MISLAIDIYRPPLGETRTLLLIGAAALLAAWVYLRPRRASIGSGEEEGDAISMALTWPQRGVLLLLRVLALVMLAWLLWGPTEVTDTPSAPGRPRVILLADVSASMAQEDVVDRSVSDTPMSRFSALRHSWLDPGFIARLRDRSDVSLLAFDEALHSFDEESKPAGGQTDLFAAALQSAQLAPAGMPGLLVILSDGHDTRRASDPATIEQLRKQGWTTVGVPVGSGASVPDLAVTVWADADSLFPGQSTHLNATVSHVGFAGQAVQVDLFHEDERIDTQRLTLGDEPSQRLRFRITPASPTPARDDEPVLHAYRIVAQPIEGERVTENNQRFAFVEVQREHIRVALFEGEPYWDTRYLAKVLSEDAQIDLTAVYALGHDRTITVHHTGGERDGGAPLLVAAEAANVTREQLNRFDVIILGKGAEAFFPGQRAQLLVDFVEQRGGALVLARGKPFDSQSEASRAAEAILAKIEPVEWGESVVRSLSLELTQAGRSDPLLRFDEPGTLDAIVTRLPDMIAATQVQKEKAASIVLLRQKPRAPGDASPARAAVAHVNAGKGKVMAVMTDGLWRWALLPSRLNEFDNVFQVFWSRTVRWLATGGEFLPGQSVSMQLSRLTTEPGEAVTVTIATRYAEPGFKPVLRMIAPDGSEQTIALARSSEQSAEFRASLRPQQSGVHRIELDAPGMTPAKLESRLAVYDQSIEKLDPSARPQVLHAMAEATGGKCLDLTQREELFSMLENVERARQTDRKEDWAFAEPAVLVGILAMLGIEWFTRRRNGLL